jgi:predicted RNase H-like HicB family nuclease
LGKRGEENMSPTTPWLNEAVTQNFYRTEWKTAHGFRIHLLVTKDGDGVYSAIALNLPGVGSCGDTEEEAIRNAKVAAQGVLASYAADGEKIPWKDTSDATIPFGAEQRWVIVHD